MPGIVGESRGGGGDSKRYVGWMVVGGPVQGRAPLTGFSGVFLQLDWARGVTLLAPSY